MILLWLVASAALVAAFVVLTQARRTARRLDQFTATPASARPSTEAFIPLTSLKR